MKQDDIVIIEDNESMRLGLAESLRRDGYAVFDFDNGRDALTHFKNKPCGLVVTDLRMEPMDGIAVLKKVKELHPMTEVLIISAYGSVETAVEAMQLGAADFLTKPFSTEELRVRVKKLQEKIHQNRTFARLLAEKELLQEELGAQYEDIIGTSAAMRTVYTMIERVAAEESPVLIQGESGTGKELVARAIHRHSKRRDKPFIRVNCGALNENLLESELFGHEKGAFTGAIKQKKGRFELAHNGTLFLDEVGDISPTLQIKFLRVLQEKEFERVGGEETLSADVRIISATNRDLTRLIAAGNFREDLYYRLSVIPIKLPALRERKDDIPLLIKHFLEKGNRKASREQRSISPDGIKLLMEYSWPGNIRELENLIERLMVISPTEEIDPLLIAQQLGGHLFKTDHYENLPLEEALFSFEKTLIQHALKKANGVKNRAAKILGIGTGLLYYKMEKFGIPK